MPPPSRRPDHVDRLAAPGAGPVGPGRAHRATPGDCGPSIVLAAAEGQSERARSRASLRYMRGHRAQMASPLVRRTGGGVAGRRETLGSPTAFTAVQVAQVKAMACTPPADTGLPLSRWSCPELARQAVAGGICASRSRRPRSAGGCPRTRSNPGSTSRGSSSPTPTSRPRRTCARPLRPHMGRKPLGRRRLCDLRRREDLHPGPLPLPPHAAARESRAMRVNHDYNRARRGGLPGRLRRAPRAGVRPLRGHHRHRAVSPLVDQVMTQEPYDSADRVFWIVDNGSSHRGQAAIDRLAEHTPTRSWCTPRCTRPG